MDNKRKEGIMVKIVNKSANPNPEYITEFSAGMDLKADILEPVMLKPGERKLISTGIYIELPEGYEAQVRPRSGLALKYGVTVLNSPGTIDSDYRGEVGVILINLSDKEYIINKGDRIAQIVISRYVRIDWENVEVLNSTQRGNGGFGHSGKN